jgi:hypothetical protein
VLLARSSGSPVSGSARTGGHLLKKKTPKNTKISWAPLDAVEVFLNLKTFSQNYPKNQPLSKQLVIGKNRVVIGL